MKSCAAFMNDSPLLCQRCDSHKLTDGTLPLFSHSASSFFQMFFFLSISDVFLFAFLFYITFSLFFLVLSFSFVVLSFCSLSPSPHSSSCCEPHLYLCSLSFPSSFAFENIFHSVFTATYKRAVFLTSCPVFIPSSLYLTCLFCLFSVMFKTKGAVNLVSLQIMQNSSGLICNQHILFL